MPWVPAETDSGHPPHHSGYAELYETLDKYHAALEKCLTYVTEELSDENAGIKYQRIAMICRHALDLPDPEQFPDAGFREFETND